MGQSMLLNIVKNTQKIAQQDGTIGNISTNISWQQEIVAGHTAMSSDLFFTAYNHYKISLNIATQIFKAHRHHSYVPNNLVPSIVTSYLNICNLWGKQNKTTARKGYLCAAFDYLVIQIQKPNLCHDLQQQLRYGLDDIYAEMVICLQENSDVEILAMKKKILMALSESE